MPGGRPPLQQLAAWLQPTPPPYADEYADAYWTEVAYGPQDKCEVSVLTGIDGPAGDVRDEEDTRRGAEDPGSTKRKLGAGKLQPRGAQVAVFTSGCPAAGAG